MGIHIHSRLMFKYREDLVCQWFFPTSEVFDIILDHGIHGIMSVEITNHGLQKKKIPRHSQYRIHESRLGFSVFPNHALDFCRIPDHAELLPDHVL